MNGYQLLRHYSGAHRVIHYESPRKPDPAINEIFECSDASALLEKDSAEIERLVKLYRKAVTKADDRTQPETRGSKPGFRQRLKSRIPEIKKLFDAGGSAIEIAEKLGLSETTIRRVDRHLRGEKSLKPNAVAVIGTHKITGEQIEFASMTQAEKYGGFQGSKIGLCLTGFAAQHRGYTWKRK